MTVWREVGKTMKCPPRELWEAESLWAEGGDTGTHSPVKIEDADEINGATGLASPQAP
jgi:hypothetical protein